MELSRWQCGCLVESAMQDNDGSSLVTIEIVINKSRGSNHKFQGNFLKQGTGTGDILSSRHRGMIY